MIEKHPSPVLGTEEDVLGRRIVAYLLDSVILVVLIVAFVILLGGLASANEAVLLLAVLGFLSGFLYYTFVMEGTYGRTPGKAAMGLVVVKEDGSPCTVGASIVRNLLWMVDSMGIGPFVVALIVFFTDRNQRVGDMLAGTVVVAAEGGSGDGKTVADEPWDRSAGDAARK